MIYHGSKVEVLKPKIISNGYYKDFGFGFYCTANMKQAEKCAKSKSFTNPIVSVYKYIEDLNLKVKKFEMTDGEWLDFIANCRNGISHDYDIVEGPMADDTIWTFVQNYLDGEISKEAFLLLAKFKYPTHQIAFCTKKALECIKFERSYVVDDK